MARGKAVIAGLGFRARCPATDIVAVVRLAELRSGHTVTGLAVPDWKGRAPGLLTAATTLGLTIAPVDRATLAAMQPRCPTRSAAAERTTGLASVAEAAALAAGGTLLLPRIAAGQATCAVASLPPVR